MFISIVIPTHRRPQTLVRVLQALAKQSVGADGFEVIVVIDGAHADTEHLLSPVSWPFAIKHVTVERARGAPAARNRGVREARGELLIFLDDDIIVPEHFVETHLHAHSQAGTVAFGGFRLSPSSEYPHVAEASDWSWSHLQRCAAPCYAPKARDLPDGNMSLRKQDVIASGGWDERITGFGGDDDWDLARRLIADGLRLVFLPEATAEHLYAKSWKSSLRDRRNAGRANLYLAEKSPDYIRDLNIAIWFSRPMRRTFCRIVRYVPAIAFTVFENTVAAFADRYFADGGGPLKPLLRFLVKLSGAAFYVKGFWEGGRGAGKFFAELKKSVTVLAYHRVTDDVSSDLTISVKEFARQITWLRRLGYQTISLQDVHHWLKHLKPIPERSLLITFDDAYANMEELVAPILQEAGFQAVIFANPSMLGTRVQWENHPPLQIMSVEELKQLSSNGFDVQAHGMRHLDVSVLDDSALNSEVLLGNEALLRYTGRSVRWFAYPFGKWSERARNFLESNNFDGAFTIQPGKNRFDSDPYLLHRELMLPGRGLFRFIYGVLR
jgi:peptidoglycan/xylan/chitin deacetylase (PgdA/CDA1 family)/GT2 family glycosyltransferase